ncbi:quinone-dependent dihydroorotate dehydrogenase [Aquibium sp. ELW1220]|uniref:quinone-dependent dihydroorotate dehydrogenase n=1 Tax=Aquibium sp. ELW1220 TaxID=2976766 RepID=UPI0025AF505E|nr:quinone-dependent dihydroorotate dehydrogenase [Aquibium sp. ELW1220]MDN2580177.1 quinone-dependent dihydroorotate dehydrogenase [Aquibium sp. ELW1220]
MRGLVEAIGRRALFAFDPETAHGLSIAALKSGAPLGCRPKADRRLETRVAGLVLPNPLGMAAGFDKNAEVPLALLRIGFGFAEVGTVTPLPQGGNPRPRIFRLTQDSAVINRLGFNNEGHEAAFARLSSLPAARGNVGVNIGANKDAEDRIADYEIGIRRFAPVASYLTVNISSPNTPGLRNLQGRDQLAQLLSRVSAARAASARPDIAIFLKIAPDLHEGDLDDVAAEVAAHGIDGVVVSNTTLSRAGLSAPETSEAGGMSGRPLFSRSTAMLARMRQRLGPDAALIGVGGVDSAEAAAEKIRAGADLVQLYTGMIYAGPALPGRIVEGFSAILDREGAASPAALRDSRVAHWAAVPLD